MTGVEIKSIYIAGWDVFLPNAKEAGEALKDLCTKYGFKGLYPLDNVIIEDSKIELAKKIFYGNIDLISQSDIIIANLNPFRGAESDSGTSFECGVGYNSGKKVYGYISENNSMVDKVRNYYSNVEKRGDIWVDKNEHIIEDFGLHLNLMLAISTEIVVGQFEDCLKLLLEQERKE